MSQLALLLALDTHSVPVEAQAAPLALLDSKHHALVVKDSMYLALRGMCMANKQRSVISAPMEKPPPHRMIRSDAKAVVWVILTNDDFIGVVLPDMQTFVVLFVPERVA
jgi:hypothetical protein